MIEDRGAAFSQVSISPRWAASQAEEAAATLHYPASDGYCSYQYSLDRKARRITLDVTGSFRGASVHCVLPGGKARRVTVDGVLVLFENRLVEKSPYVDFVIEGLPRGPIVVDY